MWGLFHKDPVLNQPSITESQAGFLSWAHMELNPSKLDPNLGGTMGNHVIFQDVSRCSNE